MDTRAGRTIPWRDILTLLGILAAAKLFIVAVLYLAPSYQVAFLPSFDPSIEGLTATLKMLTLLWDSLLYQEIAISGYSASNPQLYAFSPVYPLLIRAVATLTGTDWTASLVVANAFAFAFPLVLLWLFDLKTAILAGLFPTYLVYSTVGYSDSIALTFVALGLLFYLRRKHLAAGIVIAIAALVMYDLFLAAAVILFYMALFDKERRIGSYLRFALPVLAAGIAVLVAYQLFTGSALAFFTLERYLWLATPTTPLGQVEWLLQASGPGVLNPNDWAILGVPFTPAFFAVRNLLFEAFFFGGLFLLLRLKDPRKRLLAIYSVVLMVPMLCLDGTPAYSVPRLLLAGFPIFFGYSSLVTRRWWSVAVYGVVATLAAVFVMFAYFYAFFA